MAKIRLLYNLYYTFFSQRRAGIKSGGVGPHTNLPRAWCELSILAQCQGKIREGKIGPFHHFIDVNKISDLMIYISLNVGIHFLDSLEILITSLDQAPLNEDHIARLESLHFNSMP